MAYLSLATRKKKHFGGPRDLHIRVFCLCLNKGNQLGELPTWAQWCRGGKGLQSHCNNGCHWEDPIKYLLINCWRLSHFLPWTPVFALRLMLWTRWRRLLLESLLLKVWCILLILLTIMTFTPSLQNIVQCFFGHVPNWNNRLVELLI